MDLTTVTLLGILFAITGVILCRRLELHKQSRNTVEIDTSDSIFTPQQIKEIGAWVFDDMSGEEFEHYCAKILEANGFYNVSVTSYSGDFGVDIIAQKSGYKYAIQCKRFRENVTNKAVQEALSGKVYYGCDYAVVLTNSYFTGPAIETAEKTGVALWDRNILISMIKSGNLEDEAHSISYSMAQPSTTPQYREQRPVKRIAFPRISGKTIFLLAIIALIIYSNYWARQEQKKETELREWLKEIVVSAVNKDENPGAVFPRNGKASDSTVDSVIVGGVSYLLDNDHLEVISLVDYKRKTIVIQDNIDGFPVTAMRDDAFSQEEIVSVSLPSTLEDIPPRAFFLCKQLSYVSIPEGVVTIGEDAFRSCTSLSTITLPDSLKVIGNHSFESTSLTNLYFCNVESIGEYAFSNTNLAYLSLPSSITKIGSNAFSNCDQLISVTINEGTKELGNHSFEYCKKLSQISLPESLCSIGADSFNYCESLIEVYIPSHIKSLSSSMFRNCINLKVISIPYNCEIPDGKNPFTNCSARIVFYG